MTPMRIKEPSSRKPYSVTQTALSKLVNKLSMSPNQLSPEDYLYHRQSVNRRLREVNSASKTTEQDLQGLSDEISERVNKALLRSSPTAQHNRFLDKIEHAIKHKADVTSTARRLQSRTQRLLRSLSP